MTKLNILLSLSLSWSLSLSLYHDHCHYHGHCHCHCYCCCLCHCHCHCYCHCKVGNIYVGVFCYANDLTLISPTLTGRKCMLAICENYADEYIIFFYASKSQLLHFTKSSTQEKNTLEMKNNKIIE